MRYIVRIISLVLQIPVLMFAACALAGLLPVGLIIGIMEVCAGYGLKDDEKLDDGISIVKGAFEIFIGAITYPYNYVVNGRG